MPQNQSQQLNEIEQIRTKQQQEMLKNLILRQGMSPDARERLGRVRAANPKLATQAESISIQMIQQGKGVNDDTLKIILDRLTPKREIKITRR
ncbi:MAG: hypothetical protein GOV00_03070 [Candidatus Altiarchaeota archaeon]|nr:hypothetical protein [Candidatus Altiarchaeota archaeon]